MTFDELTEEAKDTEVTLDLDEGSGSDVLFSGEKFLMRL